MLAVLINLWWLTHFMRDDNFFTMTECTLLWVNKINVSTAFDPHYPEEVGTESQNHMTDGQDFCMLAVLGCQGRS